MLNIWQNPFSWFMIPRCWSHKQPTSKRLACGHVDMDHEKEITYLILHYIHIYIYIEREREREGGGWRDAHDHVHIDVDHEREKDREKEREHI